MKRMKRIRVSFRSNARLARERWGLNDRPTFRELKELTVKHSLSIAAGDLQLLNGRLYVTCSGLLGIAFRKGCSGIVTAVQENLSDPALGRWVFKATVFKRAHSKGFVGYGDADPTNVSSLLRGAELRIAETRATARALRKAFGIGLCAAEELGALPDRPSARGESSFGNGSRSWNGHGRIQPRLRDQLCLVIRQFKLDPNLVKRYAADFCGTETISDASRESVEAFVSHLKKTAEENREGLICKLNSYSVHAEARP
jgi:hypothetical protein